MSAFLMIIIFILLGDAVWWYVADRQLRRTKRPRLWRTLLGVFCSLQIAYILFFILFRTYGRQAHLVIPAPVIAMVYLWHLLILPITLVALLGWTIAKSIASLVANPKQKPVQAEPIPASGLSRRDFVTSALVAVPPLLTVGAVARGINQLHNFRINRIELPLASLPKELDGLTIAHVSDVHVGRFTRAHMLPAIADATNSLKADFVLLTGDLIDLTLSDLPAAIDFVRRLDPRRGLYLCEGNHDLIESPIAFETGVRKAGIPLLLDESTCVTVNGRDVQLMGLSWTRGDDRIARSVDDLAKVRIPETFPILLAHHPHAFDAAARAGIPLTLAGHTHGGQLMLTENLGAGPLMFRYWSGVYRKNDAAVCVSNGVGNWFPLRINAPAEIIHLTLRHTPGASG